MSLLSDAMTNCTLLLRPDRISDGEGGFSGTWTEGASFSAAIVLNSSIEARVAEVQGVTGLYTVTTPRGLTLEYHDVFRRERDGKVFRVTSDGDDKATPKSTALDMRQVTAEEWELN